MSSLFYGDLHKLRTRKKYQFATIKSSSSFKELRQLSPLPSSRELEQDAVFKVVAEEFKQVKLDITAINDKVCDDIETESHQTEQIARQLKGSVKKLDQSFKKVCKAHNKHEIMINDQLAHLSSVSSTVKRSLASIEEVTRQVIVNMEEVDSKLPGKHRLINGQLFNQQHYPLLFELIHQKFPDKFKQGKNILENIKDEEDERVKGNNEGKGNEENGNGGDGNEGGDNEENDDGGNGNGGGDNEGGDNEENKRNREEGNNGEESDEIDDQERSIELIPKSTDLGFINTNTSDSFAESSEPAEDSSFRVKSTEGNKDTNNKLEEIENLISEYKLSREKNQKIPNSILMPSFRKVSTPSTSTTLQNVEIHDQFSVAVETSPNSNCSVSNSICGGSNQIE